MLRLGTLSSVLCYIEEFFLVLKFLTRTTLLRDLTPPPALCYTQGMSNEFFKDPKQPDGSYVLDGPEKNPFKSPASEPVGDQLYPPHDALSLHPYYAQHVAAMTAEGLDSKGDIAAQLAWRDKQIAHHRGEAERLAAMCDRLAAELAEARAEIGRLSGLLADSSALGGRHFHELREVTVERDAAQAALAQAREGPQSVNFCPGCRYYRSTPYQVQGDSGYDRRCLAVDRDLPDNYGDQRTPSWCPYLAAGPTPPLAVVAACDCRAAVEGLLHTIRHEDRQPSESYCAALSDVIDMLTTGAMPFTCPHCGFVHYDERQRIVCNNCGEPPNKGGCDDGQ